MPETISDLIAKVREAKATLQKLFQATPDLVQKVKINQQIIRLEQEEDRLRDVAGRELDAEYQAIIRDLDAACARLKEAEADAQRIFGAVESLAAVAGTLAGIIV